MYPFSCTDPGTQFSGPLHPWGKGTQLQYSEVFPEMLCFDCREPKALFLGPPDPVGGVTHPEPSWVGPHLPAKF